MGSPVLVPVSKAMPRLLKMNFDMTALMSERPLTCAVVEMKVGSVAFGPNRTHAEEDQRIVRRGAARFRL